jgi:WhiB family redox-sensing transcriptional regulator
MMPSHVAAPPSARRVRTSPGQAWLELQKALDRHAPVPCRVGDPDRWWPVRTAVRGRAPAVQACRRCGARQACLTYALAADERFGIWGGTSPEERQALLRRRAP